MMVDVYFWVFAAGDCQESLHGAGERRCSYSKPTELRSTTYVVRVSTSSVVISRFPPKIVNLAYSTAQLSVTDSLFTQERDDSLDSRKKSSDQSRDQRFASEGLPNINIFLFRETLSIFILYIFRQHCHFGSIIKLRFN